jgi:hypothetical protein
VIVARRVSPESTIEMPVQEAGRVTLSRTTCDLGSSHHSTGESSFTNKTHMAVILRRNGEYRQTHRPCGTRMPRHSLNT